MGIVVDGVDEIRSGVDVDIFIVCCYGDVVGGKCGVE